MGIRVLFRLYYVSVALQALHLLLELGHLIGIEIDPTIFESLVPQGTRIFPIDKCCRTTCRWQFWLLAARHTTTVA